MHSDLSGPMCSATSPESAGKFQSRQLSRRLKESDSPDFEGLVTVHFSHAQSVSANFFIGSIRLRNVRVTHSSGKCPAHAGEVYSHDLWRCSRHSHVSVVFRLYFSSVCRATVWRPSDSPDASAGTSNFTSGLVHTQPPVCRLPNRDDRSSNTSAGSRRGRMCTSIAGSSVSRQLILPQTNPLDF